MPKTGWSPGIIPIISDLMTGQYNNPVRVVAFNTLEHWSDDVSVDIATEIQARCDMAGVPVPEHVRDFVEAHRPPTRQVGDQFFDVLRGLRVNRDLPGKLAISQDFHFQFDTLVFGPHYDQFLSSLLLDDGTASMFNQ